jgi:superfamily II DNA helicase RecQ
MSTTEASRKLISRKPTQSAKRQKRKHEETNVSPTTPVRSKDLVGLDTVIQEKTGIKPRPFQLEGIHAQLLRRDALVRAGTGSGKTLIAAGPHFHPSSRGKITIMVSPLLALQNEQVDEHSLIDSNRGLTLNALTIGGNLSE